MSARLLDAAPVPVTFVPPHTLDGAYGVYHTGAHTIQICDNLAPDHQLKTLAHELAHHFGTTAPDARLPRDWEECAAESTAFLWCQQHGLDTVEYSASYVGGWASAQPDILPHLMATIPSRLAALEALLEPVAVAS